MIFFCRTKRLYWCDSGKKIIESVSTDNLSDRTTVTSDVEYPYAFTIWDVAEQSILYYTDQVQEQLVAFNLKTSEKRVLKSNVPNIMQLKLYQRPPLDLYNSACAVNNGGCHQICLPSSREGSNGRVCRCSNGLQLQFDGSCRPYKSFLLYSSVDYLRGTPLTQSNTDEEALPVLPGRNIGKIDFDYKSRSIVWIEDGSVVNMASLNLSWVSDSRSAKSDFLKMKTLFELDANNGVLMSLALDWVNGLLYYSYYDSTTHYIKVTNYPAIDYHFTLFSSKQDKPFVIAVNPKLKYLYWIDQGQFPKLERSFLNGSNRTVLISSTIVSPTDLTIDLNSGDVYWADNTRDRIEKCDWNGQNRVTIKSTNLPNTKSIYVHENILYYADSRLRGMYSLNLANLSSSTEPVLIKRVRTSSLEHLVVFDEKSQPSFESPCVQSPTNVRVSACTQLCFPMPDSSVKTSTCGCAIGELSPDGRTCRTPKEYLIYAMETEVRSLNLPVAGNNPDIAHTGMPWKPVTGLGKAIGIDFDYRDNKILFTDINLRKISSFIASDLTQAIVDLIQQNSSLTRQLVVKPEGVAYDWVTDTIYYTDDSLNQVVSYKVSTGMRYVIAQSQSPRAIAVHPCKGYLYWTDVGQRPMIVRTSLAGSDYKRIITTDIKWPNGLTIDFDEEKIYWADAYYDKIERTDLDGNFRQVLTTGKLKSSKICKTLT